MMTIGERIKCRREELGLTQVELAEKLGYSSKTTIAKIETNANNLRQSKIKAIADALQTTPSFIMGWDEESAEEYSKICELFEHCYGKEPFKVVQKFLILDQIDRGKVEERIDTLLEDDKYAKKGASKDVAM